jgi:nucleotide-binding universal stress UspA family protein
MYHTILIPLENSWADETILNHIKALARLMSSRLILVHVADGVVARNQEQLNLDESEEMRLDRQYLEKRRAALAGEGFEVSARLACGDPADQIVSVAAEERCDLIAMATHGHRLIKDVVLGSVASAVRHRTDIPVLLVRAPRPQGA